MVNLDWWIDVYIGASEFRFARHRVELRDGRQINHIYSLNHPVNLIEIQELIAIAACDNQSKMVFELRMFSLLWSLKSWNK